MSIIWLVLAGLAVYLLLSKSGKRIGDWPKSGEDPVELLKKRYVNGEISEEEYKKILKTVSE